MTAAIPAERVAAVLEEAGYRRLEVPLEIAGLAFDVAGAFVGVGHSADLVIVGDMAANGEKKVVLQIEGIARALDVMRSQRPLTSIIVGPRPVGRNLQALSQVGRILAVEEAADPKDLLDKLSILLPLKLPSGELSEHDIGTGDEDIVPSTDRAVQFLEASSFGKEAVQMRFHEALRRALGGEDYEPGSEESWPEEELVAEEEQLEAGEAEA
ncbi:hypothetical protein ELG72_09630 [Rhizobium leguminosarum]|uniref:hypothetical protein n=1 Tax=Rhizobium leguminosarum TaxID=384 RepID=UPI00102FE3C0|nr:hypothetical protein [Rhizobium leguminosarum]TBG63291.1 hypothetical protein ELG72_09630 [Rhizobium leguminosarum]